MDKSFQSQDFIIPILVSKESERQSYIFDLIFKELIGIDYELIFEPNEKKYLNYGQEYGIWSHGYLYSLDAQLPYFEVGEFEGKIFPFYQASNNFVFPFDPFSICFYFVSRHEEYFSKDLDSHGRFKSENSWLFQNGWQFEPIVNYLASLIKDWIESYFGIKSSKNTFLKVEATLDIDNAFAFYGREKSLFPSIAKSVIEGDWKNAVLKYKSSKFKDLDPFNTHKGIIEAFELHDIKPSIFFLMKSGGNNANNSMSVLNEIIKSYEQSGFNIGIHPSYDCSWEELESEKLELERIIDRKVTLSRHHFIKINPSSDYPELRKCGIEKDFSMGYPNVSGFRAGICNSFLWFDLLKNQKTDLEVIPFYFMDATFIFKLNYSLDEALKETQLLIEVVRKYNGTLSFIFHNESLSNYEVYKSWGNLLGQTLEMI